MSKFVLIFSHLFFVDIIICFDGDESGYKAALRAAEGSIVELQPEKKISFLFLPENEDPDSYANKYGKENFINYSKNNTLLIHDFIFEHYYKQTDGNPSSYALFEKKLRLISSTIKDEYIRKYVLEFFLNKISQLTPNINNSHKNSFVKKAKSLLSTKNYYNETKNLKPVELKEFSLLYIILKKPELIREHSYLINDIKIFTKENNLIFKELINQTNNFESSDISNLKIDENLINRIYKYASVKHILDKNFDEDQKIIEIFNEIIRDLKNYELEFRIAELESKFSKDLSETTFNELKELKKQQKIN